MGDTGFLHFGTAANSEPIAVLDTKKENDLIIHFVEKLPSDIASDVRTEVNAGRRALVESNHSATHLLHAALRQVLGTHVAQKGSLVNDQYLRFDFSHFSKVEDAQLQEIETIVNRKIRENIALQEARNLPIEEAKKSGAMMLFGEKYGETVRMITFDETYSRELCGGCHVSSTGKIGLLKITSEGAVAAGVRRVEAVTAAAAENYVNSEIAELNAIRDIFKNPKNTAAKVSDLQEENKKLQKEIEKLLEAQANALQGQLKSQFTTHNGINFLATQLPLNDAKAVKNLAYNLEKEVSNALILFITVANDKPQITIVVSENLVKEKGLHAGNMVKALAQHIKGGGGGQPFFATAGGTDASGLDRVLAKAREIL